MKRINLLKMVFPSIHPTSISLFYLNQSNFFLAIIFSIKRFFPKKKSQNQDEATASYSPVLFLKAGFHWRWCQNQSLNQKGTTWRSSLWKQSSDSSYDCVAYNLMKTRLSESQAEAEEQNQSFPFCFWARLTKQPTVHKATTGFPTKWSPWNECENSVLMTRQYPDLGSAGFWLVENLLHVSTFREYR